MNKAFLRGLVVAAVLLINCTLLSGFIERQMTVPVRECSPRYDNAVGSQRIPADAIRWEDGQSFLYAIQEGQGLTAGLWAKRVPVNVIGTEGAAAFVMEDESQAYVLYGSRPFQDGERVLPVEEGRAQPDTLLLWVPAGASPLEEGAAVPLGEREAILYSREVMQPFLAERELAQLAPEELRAQSTVISCQELEKLLNGLPWLAGGGPAGACHLAAGHPVLRGPGTGKALALVPWLRRGMPFGLGGTGSCAGPHPAALFAAANGQYLCLGPLQQPVPAGGRGAGSFRGECPLRGAPQPPGAAAAGGHAPFGGRGGAALSASCHGGDVSQKELWFTRAGRRSFFFPKGGKR